MIKEPYNQYEPYTDLVYKLVGYDISCPEYEKYLRKLRKQLKVK